MAVFLSTYTFHIRRKPTRWQVAISPHFRGTYNPNRKEKLLVRQLIADQWNGKPLLLGPVCVTCASFFPIPLSWPKKKQQALAGTCPLVDPDLDNLQKFLSDCLTTTVIGDDNQICVSHQIKLWAKEPSTVIAVRELEPGDIAGFAREIAIASGIPDSAFGVIGKAEEEAEDVGAC